MNFQKLLRLCLATTVFTISACGFGTSLEFGVESYVTGTNLAGESVGRVEVTSKNDGEITIEEVILNRGNCDADDPFGKTFPKTLGFGDSVKVVFLPERCNLQEVEIVTRDSGSVSYEMTSQ